MGAMNSDRDEGIIRHFNKPQIVERAVSELQGIAAAVIYDGVVENDEIVMLYQWLTQYEQEATEWPLKQLKDLIEKICADEIVTSEERIEIFNFLKSFATGPEQEPVIQSIYDDVPVIFPDRVFVFTGKLRFGPRLKAQEAVTLRGGIASTATKITKNVNFLVCGDLGSVNYRQSRFGNKISKAIEARDSSRQDLYIVQESAFVDAVVKSEVVTTDDA